MELNELQVCHLAAGAPRHGDAVAGGGVRVTGVQPGLGAAAGGQGHGPRRQYQHPVAPYVQHVQAQHSVCAGQAEAASGDQVYRQVVFQQVDTLVAARALLQGFHDALPGNVAGVDDAAPGVPALQTQLARLFVGREAHARVSQPANAIRPAPDDFLNCLRVTQAGAGGKGILHVAGGGVACVDGCGDAALGVATGALREDLLGEYRDLVAAVRQPQREPSPGPAHCRPPPSQWPAGWVGAITAW